MAEPGNTGYGQQDPLDSAGEYNALNFVIDQRLARVSTLKLVKVLDVDIEAKTVDVQIMVNQTDGQGNATEHGPIYGIPYSWVQAGKNAVKLTPAKGDQGWMGVVDRDISAVKSSKAIAPPGSPRKFDPADGIYLFSIAGLNDAPEQTIEFTDAGMEWRDKNANVLISSSTGWEFTGPVKFNNLVTAQASLVANDGFYLDGDILSASGDEYAGNIHTTGTITGDTDVVSGTITLKTHRTSGVSVGGGTSGVPVP